MKVAAAYMLAVLGGNDEPDAKAIETILSAVDSSAEAGKIDELLAALKGKSLDEVIAAGKAQLASVSLGGGGGGGGGAAPAAGGDDAAAAEPEEDSDEDDEPAGGG
eukprot:CAMPEP_0205814106 /NCGR_PEP_ID=MMETSP0205-20121125/19053_1 /ASSEMBLY_ACC=CAM_ASM_000278 /TAXON_ID=36767 /ORGANISM="Euplotes focardii, Strain TN1" /LENGTH=105 /DNA_ID=CAMNT_0053097439 /DNA_START=26 /DNA_END=340 /DNA_ORIENTATION=+